jgi:hypothetical protein
MQLAIQLHQQVDLYRVDPQLEVEILEHAVATAHGPRMATSYITRGLVTSNQPEVVFTWCGPRLLAAPSASVIASLRALGRSVLAGLTLRPGGSYYLGEGALLDGVGLSGLVFAPATRMAGLVPPERAVQAIAVTGAELELAGKTSVHRVLARLGMCNRQFPWPAWSCPRLSSSRADEATALAGARRVPLPGLTVALDGSTLAIRVPRASAIDLAALLIAPAAMLGDELLLPADPASDTGAVLVWDAERQRTHVFSAGRRRDRRIGGGFLQVLHGPEVLGRVLEDGFALTLDPVSRQQMCSALTAGTSWRAPALAGDVSLIVT